MSINQDPHQIFMQRCFDLARLGAGKASPNPMVGAALVHDGRIIGEGYHQAYGQAHAEVNAVHSVSPADRWAISKSTLYVSLEPCCIYGNTPPCTDLIIRNRIPRVVISALDMTPGVAGSGVQRLRKAGVEVVTGVLKTAGNHLSGARNTFVTKERPYVILKYAQTADGFIARSDGLPFWITTPFAKRLVHKWRSESDAILVSGRTARLDDPQLTNRLYFGKSPQRVVLDRRLELAPPLSVFDQAAPTFIAHARDLVPRHSQTGVSYLPVLSGSDPDLRPLLRTLYEHKISILLVEGGAKLLQSFINQQCWDEARVFRGEKQLIQGISAPNLPVRSARKYVLDTDELRIYYPL